jgi:hypothetical protein
MKIAYRALFSIGLGAGCAPKPDADCAPMCAAAATAFGRCLDPDGAGAPTWQDAGYDDEQGFLDACDTWAWEQRLLAREAEGRRAGDAKVSAACATRSDALRDEDAPCDAFLAIDWSAPLP